MSISAKCRNCGRRYSVKDEHAGKKFRCQECQTLVSVPVPKTESFATDDWETDDYDDDFGSEDYEDYEDRSESRSTRSLPAPRRAAKKKKPAAKTKRSKNRSSSDSGSGIGAAIGKIGGGLFVGLFVLSLVLRLVAAGGFDLGGSWQSYTTPDGNVTVQLPGKAKSIPMKQLAPGGTSYGAERRGFACAIAIEPMPPELNGLNEDQMFEAFKLGSQLMGVSNVQRSTINGHSCMTFDQTPKGDIKISSLAFVHKNKFYTLNFGYKGSKGSNEQKFFNSVQFN